MPTEANHQNQARSSGPDLQLWISLPSVASRDRGGRAALA
jgi:hypothetical protein